MEQPGATDGRTPRTPYPRHDLRERAVPPRFTYDAPVIDAHTHYYAPEFVELVVEEGGKHGGEILGPDKDGVYSLRAIGGGHGAGYYPYKGSPFAPRMTDIEFQLEGMADRHVDMHSVGMTHPKVYWAPADFALRLSRAQNDGLSAMHERYPDKIVGQIMLPLQDVTLAIQELERASQLPGMHGINMGQHVNGLNISDKSFWPVWEKAEELGQPLLLHNIDPLAPDRLYQGGLDLMNALGNPFEATLSAVSLIMSGTLDAFPELVVQLPHAGGALPWLIWRIDYQLWRGHFNFGKLDLDRASDYLRRFYYDLILHDPEYTRVLVDLVGADRVVSGTDWPQGMSVWRPVEYVESIPGITEEEARTILCDNPVRMLGLDRS